MRNLDQRYDYGEPVHEPLWKRLLELTLEAYKMKRGMVFGTILFGALIAFELFNYTTTDFALTDLLGDLRFMGIRWAMILSLGFCGMDFAGIARLFTPDGERREKLEVWYLLAAWFLAATMNAMLTWWGVSIALLTHNSLGNEILSRDTLLAVVPVFVAILVWLIRILIIGTFSLAGDRLFAQVEDSVRASLTPEHPRPSAQPVRPTPRSTPPPARPMRVIGEGDEGDYFDSRPRPVVRDEPRVERSQPRPRPAPSSTTRPAPTIRPTVPVPPVRPAPKPSDNFSPTRPNGNSLHTPVDNDLDPL